MQPVRSTVGLLRPRLRFSWRWLLDSPLLLATWFCILVGTVVAVRVAAVLRANTVTQRAVRATLTELAAESAATQLTGSAESDAEPADTLRVADLECTLARDETGTRGRLTVDSRRMRQAVFDFDLLPGGAPELLGVPVASASSAMPPDLLAEARLVRRDQLPLLRADVFDIAGSAAMTDAICRDDGIALLRLPTGTDRPDFVLGRGRSEQEVRVPASGVVLVDGNLWLDDGNRPLVLALPRDLTLLVRGNVYLGRSLHVHGGGRLVVVALAVPGQCYRDVDGSGRWSVGDELIGAGGPDYRGPQEGTGRVVLGVGAVVPDAMFLEIGVMAQADLGLGVQRVRLDGPVLLCHGCSRRPGVRGELTVTGEGLPDVARELVPGFAVHGAPRPGLLRRVQVGGLPLYPATPAR